MADADLDVIAYVSGHGFGHAARVCEVLRALRARRPRTRLAVRSPLAPWFFAFNLGEDVEVAPCALDVGVVQGDSLSLDLDATERACAAIEAGRAARVAAEVAALAPRRPRLLLADIPALAFAVADALGIPGVAMSNFSWDWIYADYAGERPGFAPLVAALRRDYGRAALLLRLPLHGEMDAFARIRDVPLVARRATLDRATVRARLELPRATRLVLLSFGGLGLHLDAVPPLPGVTVVATGAAPAGCRALSHAALTAAGVRYEDLVAASDAVLTKPGYGIVAECIANRTPIVYAPRGRFAEYERLVAGIEAHLAHAHITAKDLRAGRWAAALEAAWASPMPPPTLALDGAAVVAEELEAWLDRSR